MVLWLTAMVFISVTAGVILFRLRKTCLVAEDSLAVTSNRDGFIQRVLPAGRHVLGPFETVEFILEIKTRLVSSRVGAVISGEGIPINIAWSGTYSLQPDLITDRRSQRLRGLAHPERAIIRNVDICLRKLAGHYPLQDLFQPATRDRLERQLGQLLADRLKSLGIVFNGLNLQTIDLPPEVAESFNKAKAIATLDGAIRQLDPTTREVVRGVYQLDEILHWDAYLPVPSRLKMKQMQAAH